MENDQIIIYRNKNGETTIDQPLLNSIQKIHIPESYSSSPMNYIV